MRTRLNTQISLSEPGDVLAALPHMLGFHPADSFVLLTLHDLDDTPRFGSSMRVDLPCPSQACFFAEMLLGGPLSKQRAEGVIMVVVGEPDCAGCPPNCGGECHETDRDDSEGAPPLLDLVDVVRKSLLQAGIVTAHALHVPQIAVGEPWRCYYDEGCRGVVADPKESPMGALMAAEGSVTFGSKDELRELVAPESEAVINRWAAKLDAMSEEAVDSHDPLHLTRDLRTVFAAVRRLAAGSALTEDDLVGVLRAVSDTRVRDIVMGTALSELARPAEELWLSLVRKAPEPELVEVVALLAFSAYVRGEGALASVALERVEHIKPPHTLSALLRQAMDTGLPPAELAVIARHSTDDVQLLLGEDGA
ncbi:DUF4192 domain-containing protein [Saccharopolyspora rhizosphaerae]|uniref:DUF4192 domain-containing protein n=1 Tax=Saccharopolyspora rhizosphaerae TaxID=2492662 RepID=A0A3R8P1Y7_9PSEU|nr:DUF4192 domain-containing protein [Saccharopolyspora rhizosphaerae]RRO14845.1 DUF4192 domain-containing protein [Saccharopolyspora rhizosphaerae]